MVAVLSLWRPALLFDTILLLHADPVSHPLALSAVLLMVCAACVELGGSHPFRPRLAAAMLTLLAVELVVLWSANVVTLLVSLVLYDLVYALAYLVADGSARVAMRGLFLGTLATLCLLSGAVLSGGLAAAGLWRTLILGSDISLTLWVLAAALRLSIYPFHLSAPEDFVSSSPLAIPLLLRPLSGWILWLRIVTISYGSLPAQPGVLNLALASIVFGVLMAWSSGSHLHTVLWSGVGAAGTVLLAGMTAGRDALAVVAAGSVTWMLGLGVLFLSRFVAARALKWQIPSLIGGWALLGLPGTLGFVSGAMLYGGTAGAGRTLIRLAVGGLWAVFLIPSLVRFLIAAPRATREQHHEGHEGHEDHEYTDGRLLFTHSFARIFGCIRAPFVAPFVARKLGYVCGLGLPAFLLVIAGLFPVLLFDSTAIAVPSFVTILGLPGIVGWLLWLGGLVVGGLLSWKDGVLRSEGGAALEAIYSLLRLEWLYDALAGALNRGLAVFRAADELIGGAGALLWACLIFLLYILAKGGR